MELFIIMYAIKYSVKNNGEYTHENITRKESMIQSSNYLPEIFMDIYEKHRHEWVVGVEIENVIPFNSINLKNNKPNILKPLEI